ncbi:glycosyltransferase [Larkinella punicea]|uniref:Glycosyltransferase n=1 Tax=Larkinella punicea TaxID=2315727 RepID=A0A368JIZ9_9BACT|nr:glycosyltransferase [Larkinella punicea]RCR67627.1 glycosyltransferase [Larkinella punicea]
MTEIRLWFTDFWDGFNIEDNYFINLLAKYYRVVLTKKQPDYLIFSWRGKDFYNYKNCIRIFYTGENLRPDFTICDYSISFDYDSYNGRNLRLPLYVMYGDMNELLLEKNVNTILKEKTKFCNFIYSNNNAKERKFFFQLLSKYKKIDSGGKVLNNIGFKVDNKREFIKKYKFTISFENSSFLGYTTEKIIDPMIVNSLPIYWGNPKIYTDFNVKSFVNIHDFDCIEDAISKIIKIDKDEELYAKYLVQPFFKNNELNKYVKEDNIIKFFNKIFNLKSISRLYYTIEVNIKISIIIPVYNTGNYIEPCLDSVINQEFSDYEIICINDGSTDNSRELLEKYAEKFRNLIIINQDNQGLGKARNEGLINAKGKYIVFLDSDDLLLPGMLKETYCHAEKLELDVLAFNFTESTDEIGLPKVFPYENQVVNGIFYFTQYYIHNKDFPLSASPMYLYNRHFLKINKLEFKPNLLHEDEHFFIRLILHTDKMSLLNKTLYYYRRSNLNSITNNISLKNSIDLNYISRELYHYLRYNNCKEALLYRKISQLYFASVMYAIEGKYFDPKFKIFTKEDLRIVKLCTYNFTSFFYSTLFTYNIKFFNIIVIKKRPYILSKLVTLVFKLIYLLRFKLFNTTPNNYNEK